MSSTPITKLEHFGQDQIMATDSGMEIRRQFFLQPWYAYAEVLEILLGRPDVNAGTGRLLYPPHEHPNHKNMRCVRAEATTTPQDVSFASGAAAVEFPGEAGYPFPVTQDGSNELNMALTNALNDSPFYQAAIITATYANRPEWIVERSFNNENQSLPQQYLDWKNIKENGDPVHLSVAGPTGQLATAVKRNPYQDFILTPYRHPKAPLADPIWDVWSQLIGRINQVPWTLHLVSAVTGEVLMPDVTFPAETLMLQPIQSRIQATTNSPPYSRAIAGGLLPGGTNVSPFRPICYDYWDHSFRFTYKATVDYNYNIAEAGSSSSKTAVGWNRFLSPPQENVDNPYKNKSVWDYAVTKDGKYVYEYAEAVVYNGVTGFDLLFRW